MLAPPGLALRELDRHAGRLEQAAADLADDVLVLRRLEDVVVLEVRRCAGEVAVALRVRLVVACRRRGRTRSRCRSSARSPAAAAASTWRRSTCARRDLDQLAGVDVEEIAHHHRRPLDPRRDPDRVASRHRRACRRSPGRSSRSGTRAPGCRPCRRRSGSRSSRCRRSATCVEEEPAGRALADEPSLQVGEHHQRPCRSRRACDQVLRARPASTCTATDVMVRA